MTCLSTGANRHGSVVKHRVGSRAEQDQYESVRLTEKMPLLAHKDIGVTLVVNPVSSLTRCHRSSELASDT